MFKRTICHAPVGIALAFFILTLSAHSQELVKEAAPPLSVDQVVENLEQRNLERAKALHEFEGRRTYEMHYRGFPGDRDAEMKVEVSYRAPNTRDFKVISQSGSQFVIDHVFKKLLDGEQEANSEANRKRTALNSDNYDFTLDEYETGPQGARYVLNTIPKSDNKYLYRGKIWIDATDFAVVKIEASPAKNPSFWIKKTRIEHTYTKVGGFWLPASNRSETNVRLGGRATLSIDYSDYKVNARVASDKPGQMSLVEALPDYVPLD